MPAGEAGGRSWAFVAAVIVNISVHTVEGNKVEIYLKCLGCMLRILKSSEALGKEKIPELEQYLKCLRENEKNCTASERNALPW